MSLFHPRLSQATHGMSGVKAKDNYFSIHAYLESCKEPDHATRCLTPSDCAIIDGIPDPWPAQSSTTLQWLESHG